MRRKTIGDKIRINQSLVHNKNVSPEDRRNAYLNLKRLNDILKPGGIVKAKNSKIRDIYNDNPKDVHHLIINDVNKDNSFITNTISHTPFRPKNKNFYSLSIKSNVHLVKNSSFRKNEFITKDNVFESKLNGKISHSDFEFIKKNSV